MMRIAALSAALATATFIQAHSVQAGPGTGGVRAVQAATMQAPRLWTSAGAAVERQSSRPATRLAERRPARSMAASRAAVGGAGGSLAALLAGPSLEQKPGVSYALSPFMSLALAYQFVTSEDLALELGKPASLESDYNSHNVFVRARWQF